MLTEIIKHIYDFLNLNNYFHNYFPCLKSLLILQIKCYSINEEVAVIRPEKRTLQNSNILWYSNRHSETIFYLRDNAGSEWEP